MPDPAVLESEEATATVPGEAPADRGLAGLSGNAITVLRARYLRRDEQRDIVETPDEMFARVARAVSDAELRFGGPTAAREWEERFAAVMQSLDFLPNSPTLMNAGTSLGQLSACFVLGIDDSIESIFEALKRLALVQRSGGGTGFSFSPLRPAGSLVASTKGAASGPVSFMRIFDSATENIKQGGRRRGANMGVLRVDHPDILDFIAAKREEGALRNFNLSVGVTDAFMDAVRAGRLVDLTDPHTRQHTTRVPAREIFDAIVDAAWRGGDPGLLFLDAVNRANPTPGLGPIEATNPCGETPLLPFESCNLGSINLAHLVTGDAQPGRDARHARRAMDWTRLDATVRMAVRFLDDVIEVGRYPEPEFTLAARRTRKIGLGVMGFAELLVRLGLSYDSDGAVSLARRIMRRISHTAHHASAELAADRGTFPAWPDSVLGRRGVARRNATCTAIAPTGTIGIIADTTSGIEPMFALAYRRRHVLGEQTLVELAPLVEQVCEARGVDVNALREGLLQHGSVRDVSGVPEDLRALFTTALEIPARRHLEIQAAFQTYTDNSVSKTVNLPHDATRDDVAATYRYAWELGLKGVTIYRYGSRASQVLELGTGEASYHYDHASRCDPTECRV